MALPDDYLAYPRRRRGNDHGRFPYSPLPDRAPLRLPGGADIALFVTVHFDFYPMAIRPGAIAATGAFYLPAPNFILRTLSDYGSRVGAYRVFRALDAHGIRATAVFNAEVARRYPRLVAEVRSRGWEVAASGLDMSQPLHANLSLDQERALIAESLASVRAASGQPVIGWHSPSHSQSAATYDLLAAEGVEYAMDWVNDDLPYEVCVAEGTMHALPLSEEWADNNVFGAQHHPPGEWTRQVLAALATFRRESASSGARVLSVPLHPEVIGQPFRIGALESLLEAVAAQDRVREMTGAEILAAFRASQDQG